LLIHNTRIERSSPSVTLARTPIICCDTRVVIASRNASYDSLATLTGPISGNVIVPSHKQKGDSGENER
jgi:hypothetical protein